jgi:hypothetical protein
MERGETLSTTVIALTGLGILVGSLWWLAFVIGIVHHLAIGTGFVVLFFVLGEVTMVAGIFNALATAAAYSPALMVFLQVVPA